MVDTCGMSPIALSEIRWSSDLDGEPGYGYVLAPGLSEGRPKGLCRPHKGKLGACHHNL